MKTTKSSSLTRRRFVNTTGGASAALLASRAALTAAEQKRSVGANDRLRIGLIGCGQRGIHTHMKSVNRYVESQNLEFTAVCDPWRVAREKAVAAAAASAALEPTAAFRSMYSVSVMSSELIFT